MTSHQYTSTMRTAHHISVQASCAHHISVQAPCAQHISVQAPCAQHISVQHHAHSTAHQCTSTMRTTHHISVQAPCTQHTTSVYKHHAHKTTDIPHIFSPLQHLGLTCGSQSQSPVSTLSVIYSAYVSRPYSAHTHSHAHATLLCST